MSERIDFSSIDPQRDEGHWERMVHDVVARAQAERTTIWAQVISWTRPAIAAAALALLCVAGFALAVSTSDDGATRGQAEPALAISSWAAGDTAPETRNILTILGEYHVDE